MITETLVKMRELLSAPERWTTRSFAKSRDGYTVDAKSAEAASWCVFGAARKFVENIDQENLVFRFITDHDFTSAKNDDGTHAEILAELDRLIVIAREQEKAIEE